MKGNFVVCHNEIFVEGVSIGQFASMETSSDRDTIAGTATIELPLYTIAAYKDGTPPGDNVPLTRKVRTGVEMSKLKTGAMIEVYCWYSCPELDINFEPTLVFKGYIRQVVGAFPSILKCEDMSFPLRFGFVEKVWKKESSLYEVLGAVVSVSNSAFGAYRGKQGLTGKWTYISIANSDAASGTYDMEVWKDISPYDALQRLTGDFGISGSVDGAGRLYIGAGQKVPDNKTVILDTRLNVIGCDITTTDSMFVNYCVNFTARTNEGKLITSTYGDPSGEQLPTRMMPVNTQAGLAQIAKNSYNKLTGNTNAGTINTLLYPRVSMFDFIEFTHSLFPELSGSYVCIGVDCKYGDGYRQNIKVTDVKFFE